VKRILIIAILISYSVASFGISLNYFYCCGKLKKVSLAVKTEPENCSDKSKKGCCDNKTVTIKLKIDQNQNEQTAYHFAAPLSQIILYSLHYSFNNLAINGNANQLYEQPPPLNLTSRNILFCVFRV